MREFRGLRRIFACRLEGMIAGIGDLREAVDGHVVGGMNPQHVDEAEVTVDVAFRVEEVAGVEGLGDVPPEAVIVGEEPADQRF